MEVTVLQSQTKTEEEEGVVVGGGGGGTGGGGVLECTKHSNLELRLGMSVGCGTDDDITLINDQYQQSKRNAVGGGPQKKRCFAEAAGSGSGFVDPWSLAARQEKAVLEQAIKKHPQPSSVTSRSINPPPSSTPPVVGWPPVRSFRKNLGVPSEHPTKSAAEKPKKEAAPSQLVEEDVKLQMENSMDEVVVVDEVVKHNKDKISSSSMFVKVNMEGYAVGRKIDLKAHHGYDSLSQALQKMFHNLLSAKHSNKWKQDEDDKVLRSPNYVLLYEDNEGDKMLVGDVPWEMFISSVKRLYITLDQR